MKTFKKIFIALFMLIIFCLPFNMFGANDWINLSLKYDGATHNYGAEKIHVSIDNKQITNFNMPPIILNSRTLVPLRDVFEAMDCEVLWDNATREATIIKDDNIVVFKIDSNEAIKNSIDTIILDVPAKIINDYTMVPIRAISSALDYTVDWDNTSRTVLIKSSLHIENSTETTTLSTTTTTVPVADKNQKQDGIKILWDQTYISVNDKPEKRQSINGLDVLSPTWFAIENSNGDITDKGSIEYANWAKKEGYQLWGLLSNSFDPVITNNVLKDANKRKKVIDQMLTYATKYSLDGINIDFESFDKKDGDLYLQFIKEATVAFKANNLVVSVDTLVPAPWTTHYKHKELGEIVDYVIIMSYDEHYRTSKISGSTASLPWVEKYMDEAIKLIPKDKLIMGVPFYTRLWSEQKQPDGSIKIVESTAVTMQEANDIMKKYSDKVVWLEDKKQYYVEYTENNLTKKLWVEDARSMEERMKLSRKYDLKGVAAWKRNFETDDIWNVIHKYYK